MARFVFDSEIVTERDSEGRKVSENTGFYLSGRKNEKWNIVEVIHGIEEIAGSFAEDIYDTGKFFVRTYSEPTDEPEKPRTKAIYIEDYTGDSPKAFVIFPYSSISEERMIAAIKRAIESESTRSSHKEKKRLPIPQSIRAKVLLRSKGRCEKCQMNLDSVSHDIHHKNGDSHDNRLANLILLCPNCHSKTSTYKKTHLKNLNKRA